MGNPLANKAPNQYTTSRQLVSGEDINNIVAQLNSMESGITASTTQTQAGARQLISAVNTISTVAVANDAVKLPKGFPGLEVWVINEDADSLQVYGYGSDTVDGIATATGKAQAQGTTLYRVNKYNPATGIANWAVK